MLPFILDITSYLLFQRFVNVFDLGRLVTGPRGTCLTTIMPTTLEGGFLRGRHEIIQHSTVTYMSHASPSLPSTVDVHSVPFDCFVRFVRLDRYYLPKAEQLCIYKKRNKN